MLIYPLPITSLVNQLDIAFQKNDISGFKFILIALQKNDKLIK